MILELMMCEDTGFREIPVVSRVLKVFVTDEGSHKSLYVSVIDETDKTFICSIPAGISDEYVPAILGLIGVQRRHAFSEGHYAAQDGIQAALGVTDIRDRESKYSDISLFLSTLVSE